MTARRYQGHWSSDATGQFRHGTRSGWEKQATKNEGFGPYPRYPLFQRAIDTRPGLTGWFRRRERVGLAAWRWRSIMGKAMKGVRCGW